MDTNSDGTQAVAAEGWTLVGGDEFNEGALSDGWVTYEGAGNDGKGRRTPDAVTVGNGMLVIRGDAYGNTGGVAWVRGQRYAGGRCGPGSPRATRSTIRC